MPANTYSPSPATLPPSAQRDAEVGYCHDATAWDEKTAAKRAKAGEEGLRLSVRPCTKQALAELMQWAGIEEQGEALTLMIHHLHGLGPDRALPLLEVPRHEITVSPVVERRLELAYKKESKTRQRLDV